MIEIDGIVPWSAPERTSYAELGAREIHVPARNLRRAVAFYSLVFGFCPIPAHGTGSAVIMPATARADLVIHELHGAAQRSAAFMRCWGFVVKNLDRVRQRVWELGVSVARDSGAPDQIYRWSDGRSLYVRAPDGNEIELVEAWARPQPVGAASLYFVPTTLGP